MRLTRELTYYFPEELSADPGVIHVIACFPVGEAREETSTKLHRNDTYSRHPDLLSLYNGLWRKQEVFLNAIETVDVSIPPQEWSLADVDEKIQVQFLNISRIPGLANSQFLQNNWRCQNRFLIRDEYRGLESFLEDGAKEYLAVGPRGQLSSSKHLVRRYTDTLVLGQPGIGE